MSARSRRTIHIEGQVVQVLEAWRAPSGLGLAYFALEGEPASDRRSALDAGDDLDAMTDASIQARWADAAPLTRTERRITDGEGRHWLVQGVGPIWAEGAAAADAVGIRLRCISEEQPSLELTATTLDQVSNEALVAALTHHLE